MSWDLETDTLTSAEGIKEFLAIRLELVLVVHVDNEFLAVENVGNGVNLGVVCHEPVNQTLTSLVPFKSSTISFKSWRPL